MDALPLPKFNSSATNAKEAWDDFSRCFNSYITLKEWRDYPEEPTLGEAQLEWTDEQKKTLAKIQSMKAKEVAALTIALDAEGRKILEYVLPLEGDDKSDPAKILAAFRFHFHGKTHDLFARDQCWSARQEENESIAQWEARVKVLINECNYKNDIQEHGRDRFVIGIRSKSIKQKLFMKGEELTFTEAVKIAKSCEATEAKLQSEGQVNVLTQKYVKNGPKNASARKGRKGKKRKQKKHTSCPWCGGEPHDKKTCPAQGHTCTRCSKVNHYESVCLSSPRTRKPYKVNAVEGATGGVEEVDAFSIETTGKRYYVYLDLAPSPKTRPLS